MSPKTLHKAKAIHKRGGVTQAYFRTYAVTSTSGKTYDVDLAADTCTCPARVTCSHISAANIHRAGVLSWAPVFYRGKGVGERPAKQRRSGAPH